MLLSPITALGLVYQAIAELSELASNLVWCADSPWIVCNRWSQRESGWPWMIAIAFQCGPVHPGLTSWVILSRPRSTSSGQALRYRSGWLTLSRQGVPRLGPRCALFVAWHSQLAWSF